MKKAFFWGISLFIFVLFDAVVLEVAGRLFPDSLAMNFVLDERNLMYDYHSKFGWFPRKSSEGVFIASRMIHVKDNSMGFRDHEHTEKSAKRVAFLGDSFVWGYDVEESERFTELLQPMLPGWDVENMGVSGYSTGQEYLLLEDHIDWLDPDVVFLFLDIYDPTENMTNITHKGYYKPYFIKQDGGLELKGVPVPKSVFYYFSRHPSAFARSFTLRAAALLYSKIFLPKQVYVPDPTFEIILQMKSLVESRGASFYIGLVEETRQMDNFCKRNGIEFVKLDTDLRYPANGNHWTPEGHAFVASRIYNFMKQRVLEEVPSQGG